MSSITLEIDGQRFNKYLSVTISESMEVPWKEVAIEYIDFQAQVGGDSIPFILDGKKIKVYIDEVLKIDGFIQSIPTNIIDFENTQRSVSASGGCLFWNLQDTQLIISCKQVVGTKVSVAIARVLDEVGYTNIKLNIEEGLDIPIQDESALQSSAGVTAWNYISGILQRAGAYMFGNGIDTLTIAQLPAEYVNKDYTLKAIRGGEINLSSLGVFTNEPACNEYALLYTPPSTAKAGQKNKDTEDYKEISIKQISGVPYRKKVIKTSKPLNDISAKALASLFVNGNQKFRTGYNVRIPSYHLGSQLLGVNKLVKLQTNYLSNNPNSKVDDFFCISSCVYVHNHEGKNNVTDIVLVDKSGYTALDDNVVDAKFR